MEINKNQEIAIKTNEEPVIIIAGAGSGKTFVLTQRIIYIIKTFGYNSNSIAAFTFTNKAANEIKKRVQNILPNTNFEWIGTFHSLCLKILRIENSYLKKKFLIIDEEEKVSLIKNIYNNFEVNNDIVSCKKMAEYISFIKNNFYQEEIENINYKNYFNNDEYEIIKIIFKEYRNRTINKDILDFDDIILETRKLLENNQDVCLKWKNYFNYILVDEFQDTNKHQFEIIKKLVKNKMNIFIVGDPDQMIYSWRGAYENIFNDFKNYFNKYNQIILEQNYRSTKKILDISNQLIRNNKNRIEKNLFTENKLGADVFYFRGYNQEEESKWIIDNILKLKKEGYQNSDFLILYRSNYLSRNIEQNLIKNYLSYKIFGGFKFFQRKEVKDIVAFLKLIAFDDDVSISRIYNTPKRLIGETTFNKILEFSFNNNLSLLTAFRNAKNISSLSTKGQNKCLDFVSLIDNLKQIEYSSLCELIEKIISLIEYEKFLKENGEEDKIENINEFKKTVLDLERKESKNLEDFLQEISLYTDNEMNGIDEDYISLMTVHGAKGLEKKNVFVISFNDGDFPSVKSIYNDDLFEERRLAYVALTRARDYLFISSYENSGYSLKRPSRFISEIKNKTINFETKSFEFKNKELDYQRSKSERPNSEDIKKEFFHKKEITFNVNDEIFHDIFGKGIVKKIENELIEIEFAKPHGKKTLLKNHKSIKK
ncbi:MAG: ATP-dependent helicase [Metamycoplasmataceae bacterium]